MKVAMKEIEIVFLLQFRYINRFVRDFLLFNLKYFIYEHFDGSYALFCLAVSAQNDRHYLISLETVYIEIESNFYINKIYDGRQRCGVRKKSIGNSKTPVSLRVLL
jgi:hypothetical protein